jgi:prepilin-type N-terminal cleavage/methylation domain-containing protein/prepilin-type processing-associated H-X9-DG protein
VKKPRAFTLIELLVVIAIIALLLAILTPALNAVKQRAQGVVCRSNLKQVGLAANLYAQNWKNYIPRGAAGGPDQIWFITFLPYLGHDRLSSLGHDSETSDYRNVKIYRCPLYPDKKQTVCYVINGWDSLVEEATKPTNLMDFKHPARTIYLADNEDGDWRTIIEDENDPDLARCDVFHEDHLPDSESEDITYGRRVARDRHRDGCNVLYLDWRAEYIATEDMTEQMWH